MKKIAAGEFKAKCLAVLAGVQEKKETVLITKRGKPMAKVVPLEDKDDDFFGSLKGKVRITGDIVSPLPSKEWGNLY